MFASFQIYISPLQKDTPSSVKLNESIGEHILTHNKLHQPIDVSYEIGSLKHGKLSRPWRYSLLSER